jgi:prepilin-type N-terminal cleavage/methylation domain-containing protein
MANDYPNVRTPFRSIAAFTLTELIVVVGIVAVLSTMGFVGYSNYLSNGNDFKRLGDMALIQGNLAMYRREHDGLYPQSQTGTQIQS